jgi:HAD superfamily hydrolase (TIGR01509 family)
MIKAIIFDMDGLMIDSEPLHYKAFNKVFNSFGKNLTEEENRKRYIGIADIDAAEDMVTRFNIPILPKELIRRKEVLYRELLQSQVAPRPGLIKLLREIQQYGYKIAIASNSSVVEIEIVINSLQIAPFIDGYCSAEQVVRGKPAPDVFLLAAEKLGVHSHECLVLEDAPAGIDGASEARMTCYAIPSLETKDGDFTRATRILSSLEDVFDWILLDSNTASFIN